MFKKKKLLILWGSRKTWVLWETRGLMEMLNHGEWYQQHRNWDLGYST